MGLMCDLYIGKSGLNMSQYAINTTSHNLANVDTKGYTRQQMIFGTTQYITVGNNVISKMQTGLGVNTEEVKQSRNVFLDKAYRREIGRESFYSMQYETVSEMENIYGELQGVAFQNSIGELWEALQETAKEPDSIVTRASLVERAVAFTERAENIYKQIAQYQVDLNEDIESQVNRINEIGDKIASLNREILKYEGAKIEKANDLRDKRNELLDELGQYINITYQEGHDGQVSVMAEAVPFVSDHVVFHMSTMTQVDLMTRDLAKQYGGDDDAWEQAKQEAERLCGNSQMLVPIWPVYGDREVYNFDILPTTKANTDIGGLKGLILARGTKVGNYTDIPPRPTEEEYTDEDGNFDEDAYAEAMRIFEKEAKIYNASIEPSAIMTVQAQFDQLIHGIVTTINDILCPNKEYTLTQDISYTNSQGVLVEYKAGDTIRILDRERAPLGMDESQEPGTELFSRKSVSRYEKVEVDGEELWIYNEEDAGDNYSLYTLGEIEINQEVLEDKSKLPFSQNKGTGDFDIKTAEQLIEAWGSKFSTLSPNTLTRYSFAEYYTAFIGELANRGDTLDTIAGNQEAMVQDIDNKRLSISGVSSDEELTNLIKFQHAYNAAARYINVVDEMLEHIVTRL
ncbi:MAG: flagellar hook-associated protein FlgK [Lachnospiraceae bacterium]|nr:flagellar hook-associated protein FlgK [Lachnospiraceae bacterium]